MRALIYITTGITMVTTAIIPPLGLALAMLGLFPVLWWELARLEDEL